MDTSMLLSLKLQIYTNLCMSSMEFKSPSDFMEVLNQSTDYIIKDTELDPQGNGGNTVLSLVN